MSGSSPATPATIVAPSREDPVVATASEVVGGPLGRRAWLVARRAGLWTPTVVLIVMTTLAGVLGLLAKQHCRATGWQTPDQFTHLCYSDVPALFGARGLADGLIPYLDGTGDQVVEYPVLTGLVMWIMALLTPGSGASASRALTFFDLTMLGSFGATIVSVLAVARTHLRRPWDAAMVALAPGIILTASINWDMYAVALTALATLAWARGRPAAAGVWLGLGVAAKFYPLLLLGPLLLLCLRAGRMRAYISLLGTAAAAWLIVNVPVMLLDFDGWFRFYKLSQSRTAGFSSIWLVLSHVGLGVPDDRLNNVAELLLIVLCIGIAWLALAAPRRPRFAQLAFLTLVAFVLANKVYSPQYVVWLIPFAALARPRWRDFLIWQATEAVHFVGIWLYLVGYTPGKENRALPEDWYDGTVLIHIAGTLWLAAWVIRDIWKPERDVVRADGSDDPGGGVLDGAADVLTLQGTSLARPAPVPQR